MSEADQPEQEGGIGYDPSSLPPPVSNTDVYIRAVLIELRVLNRGLAKIDRSMRDAIKAQQAQTSAIKRK